MNSCNCKGNLQGHYAPGKPEIFSWTSAMINITICLCAVDGGYGKWGKWGKCSKTCGGGQQTRKRKCNKPKPSKGGKKCNALGPSKETQECNTNPCGRK